MKISRKALLLLPWVLAAAPAMAVCVPDTPLVVYAEAVPVRFVDAPDVLLHEARSRTIRYQCDAAEGAVLRPMITGLTYVRDIDDAPAYEISSDSPLMTVHFESYPDNGDEGLETSLDALRDNPWYFPAAGSEMNVTLRFYSRGGPMRPQLQRSLGAVTVIGSSTAEFRFEVGYEFQGVTCALSDANVVLDPIAAEYLEAAGSGGSKDFTVTMNCGVPGRPVSLEIVDATDHGNMTDILAASAGSDAQGVGVQILHKGSPLPMGITWAHTDSTGAIERIPFSARYARIPGETLIPGAIQGQAVLIANYY